MERIFAPEALDELFETVAQQQYTRELLFSSIVNLMSLVVCAFYPYGENQIGILTTLPLMAASALEVAELYRQQWSVETLFQTVTTNFEGEIQTLGYPQAALFSFCLALVAYNILAIVRSALGTVHGSEKIKSGLSDFYLVIDTLRSKDTEII